MESKGHIYSSFMGASVFTGVAAAPAEAGEARSPFGFTG